MIKIERTIKYVLPNGEKYDSYEQAKVQLLENFYHRIKELFTPLIPGNVSSINTIDTLCKNLSANESFQQKLEDLLGEWTDYEEEEEEDE